MSDNYEKISGKVERQRFVYQKDTTDWIVIFIVIVVVIGFIAIFYGNRYFEGYNEERTLNERNQLEELVSGSEGLENTLEEYLNNEDFNDN